jgi:NAD(P)H-nitrite reductase large subunit
MAKHIVIIGNGISGITCARNIRKLSDHRITVISAETEHFFSRTALMYIYMGHMKYEHTKPYEDDFWKKNRIDLLKKYVTKVDTSSKKVTFSENDTLNYDILILAAGSKSNLFGWPGQELKGVQGLYNYQDLESMEASTKNITRAVVVGGGLIGIEMVEMLTSRKIPVTFLVRDKSFWNAVLPKEESEMINRHILEHHIDLRLDEELKSIEDDGTGRVKSITTLKGEKIETQFVGLTAGVNPNIEFLKNSGINLDKGIIINEYFETNVPGVYSIGDCAQFQQPLSGRKPIEQVWYTGRMHGETLAHTICKTRTAYNPGNWYNSAKFFDIEYQTYGIVNAKEAENENSFYWEHPDGKISLRIVFDKTHFHVLGFNSFGMRLRHEVCDAWITNKNTIETVISNLKEANFDPEFYDRFEKQILEKYRSIHQLQN